jgi:hypothetical protein
MTPAEWKTSPDPQRMLTSLVTTAQNGPLRQLAVTCCRRVSRFLSADWQSGIEVADRFSRGAATHEELLLTLQRLTIDFEEVIESDNGEIFAAKRAVLAALRPGPHFDPREAAAAASRSVGCFHDTDDAERAEQSWQADTIRAAFPGPMPCGGGGGTAG